MDEAGRIIIRRGWIQYENREDRFWSKVNKTDPELCWEWRASRFQNGYGQFQVIRNGKKSMGLAHRVAWELACGDIPEGMCVCHKCDNPSCVNPSHLFLGTTKENINDKVKKGRAGGNWHRGASHGNAKLTQEDVDEIIRRYKENRNPTVIARDFGINYKYVYRLVNKESW